MAGLDYNNIREPDYDPDKIRQSPGVTAQIAQISDIVLENWRNREKIAAQMKQKIKGKYSDRIRRIYYDTDGITELQQERICVCDECSGALRIETSADTGTQVLAVHIPIDSCKSCMDEGQRWFEEADSAHFHRAYLQHRPEDKYFEKNLFQQ